MTDLDICDFLLNLKNVTQYNLWLDSGNHFTYAPMYAPVAVLTYENAIRRGNTTIYQELIEPFSMQEELVNFIDKYAIKEKKQIKKRVTGTYSDFEIKIVNINRLTKEDLIFVRRKIAIDEISLSLENDD